MPVERMRRLGALLAATGSGGTDPVAEDAEFEASFAHDRQGLVTIRVKVKTALPLQCQRSLNTYFEPVDRNSVLAVIEDVGEQESVPEHYEPILVEDRRLALSDLVEEELLLAIPQVPRDPEAGEQDLPGDVTLSASSDEKTEPTHRPFEGLADLLGETD
jgi:uncharacterized protein